MPTTQAATSTRMGSTRSITMPLDSSTSSSSMAYGLEPENRSPFSRAFFSNLAMEPNSTFISTMPTIITTVNRA